MNVLFRSTGMAMAAAVATLIAASPGLAGDDAYAWIDSAVRNQLLSSGVPETAFSTLSPSQLGEVSALLGTSDSARDKFDAARAVIERDSRTGRLSQPARAFPDSGPLVGGVAQKLRAAGIEGVDPSALSLGSVQRLSQVFSENEGELQVASARAILDESARHARLSRTLAEDAGAMDRAAIALGGMRGLEIEVTDPGALTQGQVSRISAVLSQHDGASDRREAIRRILDR